MQKVNIVEPDKLLTRLERKFQRRAKTEAQRKQTRRICHIYSGFSGTDWDLIYEDLPDQR